MAEKTTKPKAPPIKNLATTGKPSTTSGRGIVHEGHLTSKNGSNTAKNGNSTSSPRTSSSSTRTGSRTSSDSAPGKNWWDQSNAHPADISASLHRYADQIWRPDVQPDADRPSGAKSQLKDARLYRGNGGGAVGTRSTPKPNGSGAKATSTNGAQKKPPARTTKGR